MTAPLYGAFFLLALLLTVVPGADFMTVFRNALAGGKQRGLWAAWGISASLLFQGSLAALGLGVLLLRARPFLLVLRWVGGLYLVYLGLQCLGRAWRNQESSPNPPRASLGAFAQGFLSSSTNPKVLFFYLAVLPQFLLPGASPLWLLLLAATHALQSGLYLSWVALGLHRFRPFWAKWRRGAEGAAGVTLLGLGFALILDRSQGA